MKLTLLLFLILVSSTNGFIFGKHFPNGFDSTVYLYGPNGTWKNMVNLNYEWNYYEQHATPNHPFNKNALIGAANGIDLYTARDANGYLLCDFNQDGELDTRNCGFAFHEHNAKGVKGNARGQPFTNFWFDDNWLARFMSQAYEAAEPNGLIEQSGFIRWRILGGDSKNWSPYNSDYYDTLSLDGLYYLTQGNLVTAFSKWNRCLIKSGAIFDSQNQQYVYRNVHENYHIGLWKILTDLLYYVYINSTDDDKRILLLQHSISLRSTILTNQETDDHGNKLGWISNIGDANTLMNTESVSVNVLALGTWMRFGFEVYTNPMQVSNGYFVRNYNVVSAVVDLCEAGFIFQGPIKGYMPFLKTGDHEAKFFLRTPTPADNICIVIAMNEVSGETHTLVVNKNHFNGNNQWSDITIIFNVKFDSHFTFGLYWEGKQNLDASYLIVN